MQDIRLGGFGDSRLEKGGPFYTLGLLRLVATVFRFAVLAGPGRARSSSLAFCATGL